MKTIQTIRTLSIAALVIAGLLLNSAPARSECLREQPPASGQRILLALLLDTSNSMDGLIDQAKSQLWRIVNEVAAAHCGDGSRPSIQIALYEYGNSGLSQYNGYIRQVSPLTNNLDLISEKLFSLRTNGGDEFCGQVIQTSLNELQWSMGHDDLKMIFIAGNEPFTQGPVNYQSACLLAKERGVVVNTIFCGDYDEGVNTSWRNGAVQTGGSYMSIEQNRKTVYVPTPYDDQIDAMNEKLNDTYVYYGKAGAASKANQITQDANASTYGKSNKVERAVSKSSQVYTNSRWDLVDASASDKDAVSKAEEQDLPKEMKGMSLVQKQAYVKEKADERAKIQTEIQQLSKKRSAYIAEHTPKTGSEASLDATMINAIKEKAKSKNLTW